MIRADTAARDLYRLAGDRAGHLRNLQRCWRETFWRRSEWEADCPGGMGGMGGASRWRRP